MILGQGRGTDPSVAFSNLTVNLEVCPTRWRRALRCGSALAALLYLAAWLPAQDRVAEFKQLARQLVERRQTGAEETEADQTRALTLADAIMLELLNGTLAANEEAVNRALEQLVAQQPPVGEEYRVLRMGPASGPWYLLAANFGLAGPSALRFYARAAPPGSSYKLAARIDRFTQQEYFDEFLTVVPVAAVDGVFVTVTGRTDELQTGSFVAWRFDGARLQRLWATDLLERSQYETSGAEFRVTYCEETSEDDPSKCVRTLRERHLWRSGVWQMAERREVKP